MVTRQYAIDFQKLGGEIIYNFKVDSFQEDKINKTVKITSENNVFELSITIKK